MFRYSSRGEKEAIGIRAASSQLLAQVDAPPVPLKASDDSPGLDLAVHGCPGNSPPWLPYDVLLNPTAVLDDMFCDGNGNFRNNCRQLSKNMLLESSSENATRRLGILKISSRRILVMDLVIIRCVGLHAMRR